MFDPSFACVQDSVLDRSSRSIRVAEECIQHAAMSPQLLICGAYISWSPIFFCGGSRIYFSLHHIRSSIKLSELFSYRSIVWCLVERTSVHACVPGLCVTALQCGIYVAAASI